MKNPTFKALIVFLAAVTVLPGCGESKSAKKAPIITKNPTAAAGQIAPGQTVNDLSEMPAVEPVTQVGRSAPSKDQAARGKAAPASTQGQTSTTSDKGSNTSTVKPIDNSGAPASTAAKPTATKPATTKAQPKPVTKPEAKAETPAVVSLAPVSVNPVSAENLSRETLVSREIIMKIGSQIGNMDSALTATPVSDEYYEQRVSSTKENPYTTTTVFSVLKETGMCSLSTTRGCVVFEKDTRSGKTINRAYYLGTAPVGFSLNGQIKVLRAAVGAQTLGADVAEVLKSKSDGIYIYPVTAEFPQATTKQVAAPKAPAATTKPATTKPTDTKKPEVKKAAPAPAAQAETKLPAAPAATVKRQLGVQITYIDDVQKNENKEAQDTLSEIWNKSDLVKAKALKASPVSDEAYETRLPSTPQNPKVSVTTYTQLLSTGACDLNLVGACVVFEKDVQAGQERTSAYYLGTAPNNNWSLVGNINIARRDVSDKGLLAKAAQVLKSKNSGIYIYSLATKGQNIQAEQKDTIPASEAEKEIKQSEGLSAGQVQSQVKEVTDESEKANAQKVIDDAVAKSTAKTDKRGHFNLCAVTSVRSDEFPKRGLKTVRRIFIADFVNVAAMLSGKDELPLKIGKGVLYCKLTDGRIQKVNIQITEYVSPFTVGLVLSKTNQNLVASGVGFANGALDILMERDFGAIVEVDAMALVGGFSVAPIILSGTGKGTPFILAGQISVTPQWMFLNVRATFGARFEIIVDPDDT